MEEKKKSRAKEKLEGVQGSVDWNENLIKDFEERQEINKESTLRFLKRE